MAILDQEAAPIIDIPPALWDVLARALRKRRDERFATAGELAAALRAAVPTYSSRSSAHLMPLTKSIPPHIAMRTTAAPQTRTRVRMAATATFVAVLLAGAAMTKTERPRAAHADATGESPSVMRERAVKRVEIDRSALRGAESVAMNEALTPSASVTARFVPAPVPTAPITEAAAPTVPVIPMPQPVPRRHRVQLVRDPGF
jgi:hypothetical protein